MSEILYLRSRMSRCSVNSMIAALPHLLEIMNEADWISDIEGKAAMGSCE